MGALIAAVASAPPVARPPLRRRGPGAFRALVGLLRGETGTQRDVEGVPHTLQSVAVAIPLNGARPERKMAEKGVPHTLNTVLESPTTIQGSTCRHAHPPHSYPRATTLSHF